ncbi:ICE2-domain-containing protein [Daldinia loculata]|uniref:ICE2-domain-containing protein n=1 Tax=Daldinia loculata TaxID=103429 RepID=UPI0020C3F339|nr:ICE2-domain-containing protein [Daldinia loculata]KAI1650266.1 ICE2-domain-containing protein [Daldinia loculata]KAI2779812.1 ICE2-domain-containing protein [Daldinia loculata]
MWWFFRIVSSSVFLLTIVLSIPISFDVGGRDSGLAYSLSLFGFYLVYSAVKLATPENSRIGWVVSRFLQSSQWIVIPTLLIWSLHNFAVDANSTDWVSRTIGGFGGQKPTATWTDWIFGNGGFVESVTLGTWDKMLCYSSPVFQLAEGFCTLLVIQAAGQISRWLVNRGRSDTWVLILLILSASIIASAVYFLWRVALFPSISNIDATLIGVTVTSAVFLCAIGILSGRGNPVESSLLFAYIVLCVYQIFTDYVQSPEAQAAAAEQAANQPEFPPLPPIIMASYSTLVHLFNLLPEAVYSSLSFLHAAFQTIAPSVMISLTYRLIVFYCATRIIPAVRESGARALLEEPSLDDSDEANRILGFLSWFSPSILISVYTSLLLQHFSASGGEEGWTLRHGDSGGNTWRWVNVAATMSLYAIELYLGSDDSDSGLVNHWKTD